MNKSSDLRLTSLHQCLRSVEQIIPCGDLAVEIFGINYGYLVSTKLIHAGQHEV